jgi:hypothetical protein
VIEIGLGKDCTPLPESETAVGELAALLTMLSVPEIEPEAEGVNVTPMLADWPGVSISGSVGAAATANCEGLTLMPLTERFAVPEFFSATI